MSNEYKLGDVVLLMNGSEKRKGLICKESEHIYTVATPELREDDSVFWGFSKDTLRFKDGFGWWEIKALWAIEEGQADE